MTEDHEEIFSRDDCIAALEAVLFAMGGSVPLSSLAQAIGMEEGYTAHLLEEMGRAYEEPSRGIRLLKLEDSYQLCTKKEHYTELIRVVSEPKKPVLTEVLLETMAIIAYKQPVTKAEIEKIRGVSSDHAVNRLVDYGLVQEAGRLAAPGRPILFATTEEFLRYFGLSGLADLPGLPEEKIEEFRLEAAQEALAEQRAEKAADTE